jgi:serine O-acetyltransferase
MNPDDDIGLILRTEFGRPSDPLLLVLLRLARKAYFGPTPVSFVASVRLQQWFRSRGNRGLAAWWRKRVESRFACFIHPEARIGVGLQTPHPVGIVVGAGCVLERNVTLYQNVTLGTSSQANYLGGKNDYPHVESDCILYAGAVLIGAVRVGTDAVVGANAVVNRDVPANSIAVGVPATARAKRFG